MIVDSYKLSIQVGTVFDDASNNLKEPDNIDRKCESGHIALK